MGDTSVAGIAHSFWNTWIHMHFHLGHINLQLFPWPFWQTILCALLAGWMFFVSSFLSNVYIFHLLWNSFCCLKVVPSLSSCLLSVVFAQEVSHMSHGRYGCLPNVVLSSYSSHLIPLLIGFTMFCLQDFSPILSVKGFTIFWTWY